MYSASLLHVLPHHHYVHWKRETRVCDGSTSGNLHRFNPLKKTQKRVSQLWPYETNFASRILFKYFVVEITCSDEHEGSLLKGLKFQSALDCFPVYFSEILPIQEGIFLSPLLQAVISPRLEVFWLCIRGNSQWAAAQLRGSPPTLEHNALPSQQVWLPHPAWSWTAACAGGFSNHKHVLKIGGRQTLNAVLICRWSYPPKPRDLQLQAGVQSYWVQTKENFTRWNHRKLPL